MSLLMDYETKTTFLDDSVLDSSYDYMDNINYLAYDQSPLDVNIGLPSSPGPMDFGSLQLNEFSYQPTYSESSPHMGTYSSAEETSPHMMSYSIEPMAEIPQTSAITRHASRSPVPYAATVPRSQHRHNPMGAVASRPAAKLRRKLGRQSNDESDDEDEDFTPGSTSTTTTGTGEPASRDSRRETVRKQRIESEQRRRDELREGYARLKDTLPASNQKASKVSLLDRATSHIKYQDAVRDQMENRLKAADAEVHRLRRVNEALMLTRATYVAHAAAHVAAHRFGRQALSLPGPEQQLS